MPWRIVRNPKLGSKTQTRRFLPGADKLASWGGGNDLRGCTKSTCVSIGSHEHEQVARPEGRLTTTRDRWRWVFGLLLGPQRKLRVRCIAKPQH